MARGQPMAVAIWVSVAGESQPSCFLDFAQDLHQARTVAAVAFENDVDDPGIGHE